MTDRVSLEEPVLHGARTSLVAAVRAMTEQETPTPRCWMHSLTDIGTRVRWFLEGVATARGALADGLLSASRVLAELSSESEGLESELAESLRDGYAVPQARRPKT